jgi:putative transposase
VTELRSAQARYGWAIGRYVVMPDHVHFFCSPGQHARSLSAFMQQWKSWTSKRIIRECGLPGPIWQHGFFDHLLRSDESYEQKWLYVRNNPVRTGLVAEAGQWPWQGVVGQLLKRLWMRPLVAATDTPRTLQMRPVVAATDTPHAL